MTLLQAIRDITKENPTEEEAMCYARDNFGILAAYLRRQEKERIKELGTALTKMCEFHEKNASWDKGDNGYYAAKRILIKHAEQ